jgi:succinyl-diaminopimelate desuccinylase
MLFMKSELELAQALIQAASPSGKESPAAKVLLGAFAALGYDESYQDEAGNAVGVFRRGEGPKVMLNGHLDTVPPGDASLWPYPPLSGMIVDGRLWGRGACDMKSALACMAFAARDAVESGIQGTLMVTGVVQEEVGGLGARYLGETLPVDIVILGEPSKLRLMLGHRGRVEIHASFPGKIAHAAKAELGDNALYHAADFLEKVKRLNLPQGGPLGGSSLTPSYLRSWPESANVVPGRAELTIDYRTIPGDEPEAILGRLQELSPQARFKVPKERAVSENGKVKREFSRAVPPYLAPGENRHVNRAREVLSGLLPARGHNFAESAWWFATDAPHLAATGAVVIGFGPGEEELAHTTEESVPLAHLAMAREAYAALVRGYLKAR